MKKNITRAILCVLVITMMTGVFSAFAAEKTYAADDGGWSEFVGGILSDGEASEDWSSWNYGSGDYSFADTLTEGLDEQIEKAAAEAEGVDDEDVSFVTGMYKYMLWVYYWLVGKATDIATSSPQNWFSTAGAGDGWTVVKDLFKTMQTIGIYLAIIIFLYGLVESAMGFKDLLRIETAFRLFLRFVICVLLILGAPYILGAIQQIGVAIARGILSTTPTNISISEPYVYFVEKAIGDMDWWKVYPLLEAFVLIIFQLIGFIFAAIFGVVILLSVITRVFRVAVNLVMSPIPLATFAAEKTSHSATEFIKNWVRLALEAAVYVLVVVLGLMLMNGGFADQLFGITADELNFGQALVTLIASIVGMVLVVSVAKTAKEITKEVLA